ncbi:hypothetical protein ElyMa_005831300 [Elysia marginata]|uniref:Reverse transcriptase domain-containing protein n=1 Tax=Elysia marginata TaxID=1093978 RepID=A0AAV4FWB7_9GAST|nr:hypothetical protein ElyMa_005831300 [Elysia marginata]
MKESTKGKQNGIQCNLWQQLDDLQFADDLALLSYTKGQMQSKAEDLYVISKSLGLRMHSGKSKVLRSGAETEEAIIQGTEALEGLASFTYLGSIIDLNGGTDADIEARNGKARSTRTQLQKIWKAVNISQKIKTRLYNSISNVNYQFCCMVAKLGESHLEQ